MKPSPILCVARALALPLGTLALFCSAPAAAQVLDSRAPAADLDPPGFVVAPTIAPGPNPKAPLVAVVSFRTDEPTRVSLTVKDGERSFSVLAEPELATVHDVAVLGMRPNKTNRVTVTIRDAAGNETIDPQELDFVTPPLPAFFPPILPMVSDPAAMEPGVTLLNIVNDRFHPTFLVALDEEGQVVWYLESDDFLGDNRRLRNGNFFYTHGRFGAVEVSPLGVQVSEWYAERLHPDRAPIGSVRVTTDTFHHDVSELPESEAADFIGISTELRVLPNYPNNEVDPTQTDPTAEVVGDVIVEFTRDGTVVRSTGLLDVLDPYRLSYDSLFAFWDLQYESVNTRDWAHANAVVFDPLDQSYIVSLRHQDAVVKIDRASGQLVWILGAHERWTPAFQPYLLTPVGGAGFEWNFHQHAPMTTPQGTLLVFDNGNGRAIPPDPVLPLAQRYSRAVEFDIDPLTMTVEQVWSYGGPPPAPQFYSHTQGDADWLKQTGNVLITDADKRDPAGVLPTWARVVEVTHTPAPQVVFEVHLRDVGPSPMPWTVYRADRVAGLYPHQH